MQADVIDVRVDGRPRVRKVYSEAYKRRVVARSGVSSKAAILTTDARCATLCDKRPTNRNLAANCRGRP